MNSRIVIVGAGPIGLYFYCLLKKKGYNPILVDPRTGPYNKEMKKGDDPSAGAYTRPTYLSKTVFALIAQKLNITYSPEEYKYKQIKNLERRLYNLAVSLEKKDNRKDIRKASFDELTNKGVVIKDSVTKKREFIPSYLIFDATGARREVVKAVNNICTKELKKQPFEIKRIAENPVKKHFIANVNLTNEVDVSVIFNHSLLFFNAPNYKVHIHSSEAAKVLTEKYGWTSKAPPFFKAFHFHRNKVIFHYETTENLQTEEQQIGFLQTLIWLKTGIKDMQFKQIPTRKFHKKPRFMSYDVDPHEVVPSTIKGEKIEMKEFPDVVPIGDALCQTDYRLSTAISDSIERIDLLIQNSREENGSLRINHKKYQIAVEKYNRNHTRPALKELYDQRRKELKDKISETKTLSSAHQPVTFSSQLTTTNETKVEIKTSEVKETKSSHVSEDRKPLANDESKPSAETKDKKPSDQIKTSAGEQRHKLFPAAANSSSTNTKSNGNLVEILKIINDIGYWKTKVVMWGIPEGVKKMQQALKDSNLSDAEKISILKNIARQRLHHGKNMMYLLTGYNSRDIQTNNLYQLLLLPPDQWGKNTKFKQLHDDWNSYKNPILKIENKT